AGGCSRRATEADTARIRPVGERFARTSWASRGRTHRGRGRPRAAGGVAQARSVRQRRLYTSGHDRRRLGTPRSFVRGDGRSAGGGGRGREAAGRGGAGGGGKTAGPSVPSRGS